MVTAVGRDLLSLIGLVAVMVVQDPVMSLFALVIAPPALVDLRKLVRRIRTVAKAQFTGGTRLFETLQETIQGIRIVKAFTLEDRMRERHYANVADVENEANKMARVANRSSPLMETLGGIAIALGVIYGGYRTIEMSATPGEFFSFITAFLLAYEPAKRLARLNIELNAGARRRARAVRGDRCALERAGRRRQAAAQVDPGRVEFCQGRLCLSRGTNPSCATCRSSPSRAG